MRLLEERRRHPGQQELVVAVLRAGAVQHGLRHADPALPDSRRVGHLAGTTVLLCW